jgi:hypothetical protein
LQRVHDMDLVWRQFGLDGAFDNYHCKEIVRISAPKHSLLDVESMDSGPGQAPLGFSSPGSFHLSRRNQKVTC